MAVFKNMIESCRLDFSYIKEKLSKIVFPNLYKMVQVSHTLPVTSATSERSFSAIRRINTYLRSTMVHDRFSDLAVLNIEKDLTIDSEKC